MTIHGPWKQEWRSKSLFWGGKVTERLIKTEAIVLRSFKYGEADAILTLFGRNTGRISAIAKGARKSKSRMAGAAQHFNYGYYMLFRGKNMYTVTQYESRQPFRILREDLLKFAYASYVSEIALLVLPEAEKNTRAFALLLATLKMIAENDPSMAARLFDVKFLRLSGYQPQLKVCVICGGALGKQAVFSAGEGGVLCPTCAAKEKGGIPVGKATLAIWNHLLGAREWDRLAISEADQTELEGLLKQYWEYILERRLKSLEFLRAVRMFA